VNSTVKPAYDPNVLVSTEISPSDASIASHEPKYVEPPCFIVNPLNAQAPAVEAVWTYPPVAVPTTTSVFPAAVIAGTY
jgi:hypothetical protein